MIVCIPCRWETFHRNAGVKQEFVEEYTQLFEKNRYVFLCMVTIDTVVLKIYCPATAWKIQSNVHS